MLWHSYYAAVCHGRGSSRHAEQADYLSRTVHHVCWSKSYTPVFCPDHIDASYQLFINANVSSPGPAMVEPDAYGSCQDFQHCGAYRSS